MPAALADLAEDRWAEAAAGIMTTDTLPGRQPPVRARWRDRDRHRDQQGRRDDQAEHGDHARLYRHRRQGRPGRAAGSVARRRQQVLQPHHHRRRYLHQRLLHADRHRSRGAAGSHPGQRRAVRRVEASGTGGFHGAGPGHRSRRRGRDQVRHCSGQRRRHPPGVPGCRLCRGPLAADQDRAVRLRPELGTHSRRGRTPAWPIWT